MVSEVQDQTIILIVTFLT